ncbi:MAG: hypothetical protein WCQ99_03710, partial [Pseudomonadota bacterium]
MNQIFCFCTIIALTHIFGCAGITQRTGNLSVRIDSLLGRQEYGKALALVASMREQPSSDIASLQEIETKIRIQTEHYEQQVMADAEKSAANNDWQNALALYQEALSRLPESKSLQQGRQ